MEHHNVDCVEATGSGLIALTSYLAESSDENF